MRLVRALILLLCVLLLAIVAVAVLEEDRSEAPPLTERVATTLRDRSAPASYRRCLDAQLGRRLTERENDQAGTDLSRATRRKLRDSGIVCARRLITSGRFTAQEVIDMQARLRPPGF
jgi:hypothetical protein